MFDSDYSEVASLSINREFWKINDSAWLKDRENYWKKDIKKRARLLLVDRFSGLYVKEDLDDLGDYFIRGGIAPYETMLLFVLLWFHPSKDKDVWREIKKSSDGLTQDFVRSFFYKTSFSILDIAMDGSRKYGADGIVGDRIGLLYEMLVLDNSSKWDQDEKIAGIKKAFQDRPKSRYIGRILGAFSNRLDHNDIGQFFIDEWIRNLEVTGLEREDQERVESIFISVLLYNQLFDRTAIPYESLKKDIFHPESTILIFDLKDHDAPLQRSMAKELFERIEGNTNFPAEVNQLWNDTKRKVEDCIKNYSQYIK